MNVSFGVVKCGLSASENETTEADMQPLTFATQDAAEGGRAMLKKRAATFEGR